VVSVDNLKIKKNITRIKKIFCELNSLILKNKPKKDNSIIPIYKVKLGLTKQIDKKIINAK
jgi:transcription initiation factor TFIIIB Brf1 subunit/transcription initiation factor TFIIB